MPDKLLTTEQTIQLKKIIWDVLCQFHDAQKEEEVKNDREQLESASSHGLHCECGFCQHYYYPALDSYQPVVNAETGGVI